MSNVRVVFLFVDLIRLRTDDLPIPLFLQSGILVLAIYARLGYKIGYHS